MCVIDGCRLEARSRGLCPSHYQKIRREGGIENYPRMRGGGEGSGCGTMAGSQRHRVRGEEVCAECRVAAARYMREWRTRTGRTQSTKLHTVMKEMLEELKRLSASVDSPWLRNIINDGEYQLKLALERKEK